MSSNNRRNRNIQPDRNNSGGNPGNYNGQPNFNGQTNYNGQPNNNGQPNMNNLGQMLNNIDLNQVMGQLSQMFGAPQGQGQGQGQAPRAAAPQRDPRLQLLQSMRPFLNARRGDMLDRIGMFYSIVRLLRKR